MEELGRERGGLACVVDAAVGIGRIERGGELAGIAQRSGSRAERRIEIDQAARELGVLVLHGPTEPPEGSLDGIDGR